VLEIISNSIRLIRDHNRSIPDAVMDGARLPFFPPKIPQFTIEKMLGYIQKPADWNALSEGEKEKEPALEPVKFSEESQYEQ
jgi:hypothetical protein